MRASPTSFEERLECFLDAIQKKKASPLLAVPTRPAVQPSKAPKRSSYRLASSKLARIPIARCGKVLLMRRFGMELDRVFKAGLSGGRPMPVRLGKEWSLCEPHPHILV
jgi:hypothetical protein